MYRDGSPYWLSQGDVIIAGGNSNWKESIGHAEQLKTRGIALLDCGTSGGIWGLENGYCLMVGGQREMFDRVEPAFRALAPPGGYAYVGRSGAGHFVNVSSIGGHFVVPTGAVYCATKFAVRAISEGLRQESKDVRVTIISPGVVESELADTITDAGAKNAMDEFRANAMSPDAIARAILFAIEQPAGVSVSEIIVRPTGGA